MMNESTMPRVNILVVEDLPQQQLTIVAALEELGENIVCVSSGREALKYLLDGDAAVILLDVNMPMMDGFETAALIRQRERTAQTPIIFLTADTDEMLAARGYALGAVDYMFRPFVPDVLRTKVRVFVELSRAQQRVEREAEQRIALSREQAARAAAEAQGQRLKFLAEATSLMSRSLEQPELVEDLLALFVPVIADVAGIALLDPSGAPATTEPRWIAAESGNGHGTPAEPEARAMLDPLMSRVLETGNAETWPGDWKRPIRGAVLPLFSSGQTFGVLAVAMEGSQRQYTEADLDLLHDVAHRAAIALENRRLYQELHERDRRKDEFLAMLSHELRNPLGAITTAVHLLEMVGPSDERTVHARNVIHRQSLHLKRMVDDLLEVSRVTAGRISLNLSAVRLDDAVDRVIEALRAGARLDGHEIHVTGKGAVVRADATRLEQIISNLIVNAIKYTQTGGHIQVQISAEGDEALLTVTDDGIGIAADLLPHVFDVFVQGQRAPDRTDGGLGIGLTLVRKLVQLQGGSIEALSDGPGHGSTFILRLPRSAVEPAPEAPEPPVRESSPMRILVVDDNADFRETLRAVLELQGHEVFEAVTGPAAVAAALEHRPQVGLIDLGLPGFDGFEVARQMRADARTASVVLAALTGYGQTEDRQQTASAGFDAHLVKPIGATELAAVLHKAAQRTPEPVTANRSLP